MKLLFLATMSALLSACATQIPSANDSTAIITFQNSAGDLLMANKVNGVSVDNGRYFSVSPGNNKLEVLITSGTGQESSYAMFATLEYSDFAADNTYEMRIMDKGFQKSLQLIDCTGSLLSERAL